MRRLFQECRIGEGNASLLSEALSFAGPGHQENDIIKVLPIPRTDREEQYLLMISSQEFYAKCLSSQELICAQIPWASAGAERASNERTRHLQRMDPDLRELENQRLGPTNEEKLLSALLSSNAALVDAIEMHNRFRSS
jgi:hypothetical protein